MKPVLLIGCGGHAHSLIDLIETIGQNEEDVEELLKKHNVSANYFQNNLTW